MTNNNIHTKNNIINNVGKANNKINLNMYKGALNGNIIEQPIITESALECLSPLSLDFSCQENSQYINVL